MNRILKPIVALLAVIYFLVDAVFMPVAKRISDWVAQHWVMKRVRAWIVSLPPYPTLLLFVVPVAILEPLKPISLYLMGVGDVTLGMTVLVVGELLKLVLIERLFNLSRDKLMAIPAFAWSYGKYRQVKDWIVSSAGGTRRPCMMPSLVIEVRDHSSSVGMSMFASNSGRSRNGHRSSSGRLTMLPSGRNAEATRGPIG